MTTVKMTTEATNSDQLVLPFSLDEKSFSFWVAKLEEQYDEEHALNLVLGVLRKLKQLQLNSDLRASFLEKIARLVFQLSEKLEESYRNSFFPYSKKDTLKINLSNDCAISIAENYSLICKDISFKTKAIFSAEQKALILFRAIQAMSKVIFYKAMLYEKPRKGFWGLCYLFYLFAKQNDVLFVEFQGSSFSKIFKKILIFQLSNAQQFNTEEIQTIFKLLNHLAEQVEFLPVVPEKRVNSVPCINLRIDAPPAVSKEVVSESSASFFYVSNLNLIKQLFDYSTNKSNISYVDKIMILRLIKTLTMNQHRESERELADNEIVAQIGFEKLNEFLLHKENLLKNKGIISYEVRNLSVEQPLEKTVMMSCLVTGMNRKLACL